MTWNRPNLEKATEAQKKGFKPIPLCVAGTLAFAGLVAAFLWHTFGTGSQSSVDTKLISTQNIQTKGQFDSRLTNVPTHFVAKGTIQATTNVTPPVIEKADVFFVQKIGREVTLRMPEGIIFTNSFNNFVAEVLTATPGSRFLDFDLDWMDNSFKESLKERIEILPDDSEEVVATKQAVQEAREQILKHVRRGGNVCEIVAEARAELNKIADYRDQLQNNLNTILTEGNDPQTALDYAAEANKLLAEYGAYPLDAPQDLEDALDTMASYKEAKIQEDERLEAEKGQEEKKL